tara:strand:+ start:2555 stop:3490 length:936 start_codon:yes stop_codon:yes gene_type:complete
MKTTKIFLTGHKGFVGSAILRELKRNGYQNVVTATRNELDLTNQLKTFNFLKQKKIKKVIIASAKVGGIKANYSYPAEFIYENLAIQNNLIHGSFLNGIKDLIFLGSSCIYPKYAKQPISETSLLTSELEKTNEAYAIAKIAGVKLCEYYNKQYKTNYKCLMPCNVYGPKDNYDLESSHFLAAILKKTYIAKKRGQKKIVLWGSGSPKRELLFVDDLANACIFFLEKKTNHFLINIGSEIEHSIKQYANMIKKILKFKGNIIFDKIHPDGTPRKLLDCKLAKRYGWKNHIKLTEGLILTKNELIINFEKYE